jgi:hypothetical protein
MIDFSQLFDKFDKYETYNLLWESNDRKSCKYVWLSDET